MPALVRYIRIVMAKSKKKHKISRIVFLLVLCGVTIYLLRTTQWEKSDDFTWNTGGASGHSATAGEVPLCEYMVCEKWLTFWRSSMVIVSAYAKADDDKAKELNRLVARHNREIKDEIRAVVTSSDYAQLTDPNLKAITNKIADGLEKIIGKGYISKLLIPVWHVTS